MSVRSITDVMDEGVLAAYMERINTMATRASQEAAAAQPAMAQFNNALALIPTKNYARIVLQGEHRIVLVINVPNPAGSPGVLEISRFFDSADQSDRGRTLLKSHCPEPLGEFEAFCQPPQRKGYLQSILKYATIDDSVQLVRVIDLMERSMAGHDEAAVWAAIGAVKAIQPLAQRQPADFDKDMLNGQR